MKQHEPLDKAIRELIGEFGFANVVAALARYAHSPDRQDYSVRKMGVAFNRLNKLYEYLVTP